MPLGSSDATAPFCTFTSTLSATRTVTNASPTCEMLPAMPPFWPALLLLAALLAAAWARAAWPLAVFLFGCGWTLMHLHTRLQQRPVALVYISGRASIL